MNKLSAALSEHRVMVMFFSCYGQPTFLSQLKQLNPKFSPGLTRLLRIRFLLSNWKVIFRFEARVLRRFCVTRERGFGVIS